MGKNQKSEFRARIALRDFMYGFSEFVDFLEDHPLPRTLNNSPGNNRADCSRICLEEIHRVHRKDILVTLHRHDINN